MVICPKCGAPRAKPAAPYFTPQWGDIPAKRWRIHPRPKAVAFCCRGNIEYEAGKKFCKVCGSFLLNEEGYASIQRTNFQRVWMLH